MKRTFAMVGFALVLSLALVGPAAAQANKVAAVGSTLATFPLNTTATLLSTTIKTSTNADLLIGFTSECNLGIGDLDQSTLNTFTQNNTFSNSFRSASNSSASTSTGAFSQANASAGASESDQAVAQVRVWVEIDGVTVRVQANNPDGSVVLCNKSMNDFNSDSLNLSTSLNTSLSDSISVFSSTSTFVSENSSASTSTSTGVGISETDFRFNSAAHTNGFNWSARNVGQGTHTVAVKAHVFAFIGSSAGSFAGGGGSGSGNAFASANATQTDLKF